MGDSGDAVHIWRGNYRFGRDPAFFPELVRVARRYADRDPARRPPESAFVAELDRLAAIAPAAANGFLHQVEHRWRHPNCPACLYVLTFTLQAPADGSLLTEDGTAVSTLPCTKVGKATRTAAARVERYTWDVVGGVPIVAGTMCLRLLAYGDGPSMISEGELQAVARSTGSRARVLEAGQPPRRVGSETYVGTEVVKTITAFTSERTGLPST